MDSIANISLFDDLLFSLSLCLCLSVSVSLFLSLCLCLSVSVCLFVGLSVSPFLSESPLPHPLLSHILHMQCFYSFPVSYFYIILLLLCFVLLLICRL